MRLLIEKIYTGSGKSIIIWQYYVEALQSTLYRKHSGYVPTAFLLSRPNRSCAIHQLRTWLQDLQQRYDEHHDINSTLRCWNTFPSKLGRLITPQSDHPLPLTSQIRWKISLLHLILILLNNQYVSVLRRSVVAHFKCAWPYLYVLLCCSV